MTRQSDNANQRQGHHDHGPDRTEKRIALTPGTGIELTVHNINGDIRVQTADRDDVQIRSLKTGRRDSRRYEESHLIIEARDNRIEVRPHLATGTGSSGIGLGKVFGRGGERVDEAVDEVLGRVGGANGDVRFDIDIDLPRHWQAGTAVQARNVSGPVSIANITGAVNAATASGDVEARGIDGDLTIHTASGDALIDQPNGNITARSASGDVRITAAVLGQFGLTTVSGDVNVDGTLTGVSYRIQTVSGDAQLGLRLPAAAGKSEPNATVTFQTVSGAANVAAPFQKVERRTWRAGSGSGTNLAVKTVSGDLNIQVAVAQDVPAHAATDVIVAPHLEPPVAPEPPAPPKLPEDPMPPQPPLVLPDDPTQPIPDTPESAEASVAQPQEPQAADEADRLAVLQALERGEIDIEEALNRLEAMGEEPTL